MFYECAFSNIQIYQKRKKFGKWPIIPRQHLFLYLYSWKEEQRKAARVLANRHAGEGTHPIVTQCFQRSLIYPSKPKISNLYNSMFFSFSHDLLRHIWKRYQQEEKAAQIVQLNLSISKWDHTNMLEGLRSRWIIQLLQEGRRRLLRLATDISVGSYTEISSIYSGYL